MSVGVGRALRLEHVVGPPEQLVAVLGRDAEHVADHDDGQRRRDVVHEVALPRSQTLSMMASQTTPEPVLHGRGPAWG